MNLQHLAIESFVPNRGDSLSKIKTQCQEQIEKLGYQFFNYTGYFPVCEESHEISSFPENWCLVDSSNRFSSDNPIFQTSQNRATPFLWADIASQLSKNKNQLIAFLKHADQHDIHGGLCLPVHGAGAEWGMLNVASGKQCSTPPESTIQVLQLFATSVHEAVKHANAYHIKEHARENTLSPRERECLDWIAAGKTAWETAQIIGITESTVAFHIRNTINKLNASNRAHAVAVAMARSLIHTPHCKLS